MKFDDRRITTVEWTPPWIPFCLEDGEPPHDRWLLICVQPRVGPRDVNIGNWDAYRKQWRSRLGFAVHGTVTHWMELPKGPGE